MPARFRTMLAALGAFILLGALLGIWSGAQLTGWAGVRGVGGGLISAFIGARITVMAYTQRWPAWLAKLLGEDDAT